MVFTKMLVIKYGCWLTNIKKGKVIMNVVEKGIVLASQVALFALAQAGGVLAQEVEAANGRDSRVNKAMIDSPVVESTLFSRDMVVDFFYWVAPRVVFIAGLIICSSMSSILLPLFVDMLLIVFVMVRQEI